MRFPGVRTGVTLSRIPENWVMYWEYSSDQQLEEVILKHLWFCDWFWTS